MWEQDASAHKKTPRKQTNVTKTIGTRCVPSHSVDRTQRTFVLGVFCPKNQKVYRVLLVALPPVGDVVAGSIIDVPQVGDPEDRVSDVYIHVNPAGDQGYVGGTYDGWRGTKGERSGVRQMNLGLIKSNWPVKIICNQCFF